MNTSALQNGSVIVRAEQQEDARVAVTAERTDNQLVELVLAGDEAAFEEIFHRHKRLTAVIASRHFRRPEEIEEIVQTAFAKAFAEMASFRGRYDRSFSSWMVTITSNVCLDLLRKQKRRPERLECDLSETESQLLLDLTGTNARNADDQLANSDLAAKLLALLPANDRSLLEMLYVDELSVAEIAERQNCSKANIKVRAWRARGALRKVLGRYL